MYNYSGDMRGDLLLLLKIEKKRLYLMTASKRIKRYVPWKIEWNNLFILISLLQISDFLFGKVFIKIQTRQFLADVYATFCSFNFKPNTCTGIKQIVLKWDVFN